jgi:tetratricopeptide (TPR) repeat protein
MKETRMRIIVVAGVVLSVLCAAAAIAAGGHSHDSDGTDGIGPAVLLEGIVPHHHAIATGSAEAQRFFDQGLTLIFAFNHEEAARSFRRAAALDPKAAMPWWGIALALGPNINLDVDPAREKGAADAVREALRRAEQAPDDERAYIEAVARRYSDLPDADLKALARDYAEAMRALSARYPDDLDAATLYAESLMDLRPWKLWDPDGRPAKGTKEIVAVLESVLRRDPDHPGANHYYIHAVEASPNPERALASAARLERLVPGAGHLVHMPAHIYVRTGDYERATRSNEAAAAADRTYLKATGAQGIYPLMYYSHNLHFLAYASGMEGRFVEAKKAADMLVANVAPAAADMPMIEPFVGTPLLVLVRFHRWDEILKEPAPGPGLPATTALWRFARGVAFAALGKAEAAGVERDAFSAAAAGLASDAPFGLNKMSDVLAVAAATLDARIALARDGQEAAEAAWRRAVGAEDALAYNEPPDWFYPVRESLGAALLQGGRYAEAEAVFRDDLGRNPRNGRSLFGLLSSLKAQGKVTEAGQVRRLFEAAWARADGPLTIDDL